MVYDDEPQVIIAEVEYMGPFRTCLSSFGFRNTVQPCNIVEQWHNAHVTFTISLSEPGSNGIRLVSVHAVFQSLVTAGCELIRSSE